MTAMIFSRASQCDGKRRYMTRTDAKRAAKFARKINGPEHHYRVYWCAHCTHFHFGHDVYHDAALPGVWRDRDIPTTAFTDEAATMTTKAPRRLTAASATNGATKDPRATGKAPTAKLTATPTTAKVRYLIGVDPGAHTGIGVWDREARQLIELRTLDFWTALEYVVEHFGTADTRLVIEDPNLNPSMHPGTMKGAEGVRAALRIAQNVGENKAEARLLIEGFSRYGFAVETFRPSRSKPTESEFRRITGWAGRCSSHARDAAMFVYGR